MISILESSVQAAHNALSRRGVDGILNASGGGVAITFAMLASLLMMLVGGTIDLVRVSSQKAMAQSAVDAASLAAAKEMSLTDSKRDNTAAVVQSVVDGYMKSNAGTNNPFPYKVASKVIDVANSPMQVEVSFLGAVPTLFGQIFGLGDVDVAVGATATIVGKPNICLLALDPSSNGAIDLNHQAKVVGQNCSIFSNSLHNIGIKSKNDAELTATSICSAGGAQGGGRNFSPRPTLDCPQFSDPLAGRPEPSVGPCVATDMKIADQTITLKPGTYCGGIAISGTSIVTFEAGLYVVSDGPLVVEDTAKISGVDVSFYFSGQAATFSFATNSTIDLSAQKSGPLAGLLFFGSRSQLSANYGIFSDHAHQLLGTIYLPEGILTIDANKPIANLSAYTAIVARKVIAFSGPTVTLNTNYYDTDVPVPDGIRGATMPAVLTR